MAAPNLEFRDAEMRCVCSLWCEKLKKIVKKNRIKSVVFCFSSVYLRINYENAYSGRYPFTNSGDIRSVRW